jgi:hypothetical protein
VALETSTTPSQMDTSKNIYFGTDAKGKFFCINKVAQYIKMEYNAMAVKNLIGYNVRIECPIPINHKPSINALVEEFRDSFACDANIAFNFEHNAFYFDFS